VAKVGSDPKRYRNPQSRRRVITEVRISGYLFTNGFISLLVQRDFDVVDQDLVWCIGKVPALP